MPKYFVHSVDTFVGANISKAFSKLPPLESEGEEGETLLDKPVVIGTLSKPDAAKPLWVSKVVAPTAEAMLPAFMDSTVTVLDCLGAPEAAETLLGAIVDCKLPEGTDALGAKALVGVSSVMTWTRTTNPPLQGGQEPEDPTPIPLEETEYKKRRPHSNFKELLALEKMITRTNGKDGLKTYVVAAGLTYGQEEDVLHPLFKAAWSCLPLSVITLTDATNILPTVHIDDLAKLVLKVGEPDFAGVPYILAVDHGQEQEEKPTLKALTEKLSAVLGVGATSEVKKEEVLLLKDYEFFQAGCLLKPGTIDTLLGDEDWTCKDGPLAKMDAVVDEFRKARGLEPMRALIHGNDDVAKAELAASLAAEYKVSHVTVAGAVAAAKEVEDELGTELKKLPEGAAVPPKLVAEALFKVLDAVGCRNQGYVLEGFPATLEEALMLFTPPPSGGEGEEGAEAAAEGEEGEVAPKKLVPPTDFVVVCDAADEAVKEKLLKLPETALTEAAVAEKLAKYAEANAEDAPTSLLASTGPLGPEKVEALTLDTATADLATLLAKARIYLGPSRNYGPTDEELAAAKAIADAEAKKLADEAEALEAKRLADEEESRGKRSAHEAQRLAELQQQERELLEVRSIPLRNYLMQHVIPTLTEGLIEVCKVKPEDPIDHLAEWLFKNNPVEDDAF